MKWVIFHVFLRPLIVVNYWLRRRGILPDKWFWADRIATGWGYFVKVDL